MNSSISVLALICGGISIAATAPLKADTRDDVLAGVMRCGVIQDDRIWLECVYGAQQPMRARLALPPAPEFQQRLVPPASAGASASAMQATARPLARSAPPPPRGKPGFFGALLGDPPPFAVSQMRSYRFERNGAFVVSLENGQEWRQTDIDGGAAAWTRKPSAYTVTITSGSFNSYTLTASGSPRKYRVERLR